MIQSYLIWVPVIVLATAGISGYANVKSDIAVNTSTIDKNEDHNKERYEDLKEGQKHMQELLEELLREGKKE